MSLDELTTYEWCRRTGGALTGAQKRRLVARGLATFGAHGANLVKVTVGRRDTSAVALPEAPDSALVAAAVAAAADQGPDVEGHGFRTWLFGGALAARDGVDVDPELLCVAGICHDAGTAQAIAGEDFTVRSADIAVQAFADAGRPLDDDRATMVRNGIVAHATAGVTPEQTAIGTYVQQGALLDLAGMRLADLPGDVVREVFQRHPAGGVRDTIRRVIAAEAKAVPDGRFALSKKLGLSASILVSPTMRRR